MNCENISITDASLDDLRDVLDLLSVVQLPHDGVAENVAGFLVARDESTVTLTGDGEPVQMMGANTSAGYFAVVGVEPMIGRRCIIRHPKRTPSTIN